MRLYAFLDRLLPHSFLGKAIVVAALLGQGPYLALALAWYLGHLPPSWVAPALAATALCGVAALAVGLRAVLIPVVRLEAAFVAFEAGRVPEQGLPDHHKDPVGRLMATATRLMQTTETRIDAAQRLAELDPLTGLLNRRGMERSLARRHGTAQKGAVIMMDLDHFKRVNDTFGHDVGDRVLRDLARIVRLQMRRVDLAARFGGEEFVLYLSDLCQDGAIRMAERLRMAVEDHLKVNGQPQTVSIGVAIWPAGESFATVLKHADTAVYAAKSAGRNRVHLVPAERIGTSPRTSDAHDADAAQSAGPVSMGATDRASRRPDLRLLADPPERGGPDTATGKAASA